MECDDNGVCKVPTKVGVGADKAAVLVGSQGQGSVSVNNAAKKMTLKIDVVSDNI